MGSFGSGTQWRGLFGRDYGGGRRTPSLTTLLRLQSKRIVKCILAPLPVTGMLLYSLSFT